MESLVRVDMGSLKMLTRSNRTLVATAVGLMLVAAGCGAMRSAHAAGLPRHLEAVGGGLMINWKAPVPGTVYLVEKTTGKIIETRSLDEGEVYEFEIASDETGTEAFEKIIGVKLTDARLVLYFKPASSKKSAA